MTATAQVSRTIPAGPDKVWKTLTTKEGMKAYMMGADVETDWKVGSPITMKGEFNGHAYEDTGEVRSFEPGKRFSYTHQSGSETSPQRLVTFEVAPRDDGTEVTITQENVDGEVKPSDREHRAEHEKTWNMMLDGLEKAVAN